MSVQQLRILIDVVADMVLCQMNSTPGSYFDLYINPLDGHRTLAGYPPDAFTHRGLYGIRLLKEDKGAIAYIGKTENDNRLRHHIFCENKNGSELVNPGSVKNDEIRRAIAHNFNIQLCLFKDPDLDKPTLSCLEIACILKARAHFIATFPGYEHWNRRVG